MSRFFDIDDSVGYLLRFLVLPVLAAGAVLGIFVVVLIDLALRWTR